jgi:hypothetical protein
LKRNIQDISRLFQGALVAAIFLCGTTQAGATGKYTKKEAEVVAMQTELTKPAARASGSGTVAPAKPWSPKPAVPVKDMTDGQIKLLEKLNAMTREDDPEKPDLLFRLGQLYEEQSRYYNFLARALDEEIFQASANLTSI